MKLSTTIIFLILFLPTGFLLQMAKNPDKKTQVNSLPVYMHAPEFKLIDTEGNSFSSTSLANDVWVVSFFFTSCGHTCPVLNGNIYSLYNSFKDNNKVKFVSITVDPETDTPEHLKEYGSRFDVDRQKWRMLTGNKKEIYELINTRLKLNSGGEPSMHTTRMTLIDDEGNVRGFYQGMDRESVEQLRTDLEKLL